MLLSLSRRDTDVKSIKAIVTNKIHLEDGLVILLVCAELDPAAYSVFNFGGCCSRLLSWAVLTWRRREELWANDFPQPSGHLWPRFPSWTASMCEFRWPLRSKFFPQKSHLNLRCVFVPTASETRCVLLLPLDLIPAWTDRDCSCKRPQDCDCDSSSTSFQYREAPECGFSVDILLARTVSFGGCMLFSDIIFVPPSLLQRSNK